MTKPYKYMHTMNGRPAEFIGGQICFATHNRPLQLADDLPTIKSDQSKSRRYRKAKRFEKDFTYGWLRVLVDGPSVKEGE